MIATVSSSITSTTRVRLPLGAHDTVLDAMAVQWGQMERGLHARLARLAASGQDSASARNAVKVAFCAQWGITARQYNSLITGLKGLYASRAAVDAAHLELVQARLKATRARLKTLQKALTAHDKAVVGIAERAVQGLHATKAQDKARLWPKALHAAQTRKWQMGLKIQRQEAHVARLEASLGRAVPAVVFGGKKRLRARAGLDSPADIAAWRAEWDAARSGAIFAMGSKDEPLGNQSCKLDPVWGPDGTVEACTLRVRTLTKEQGFVTIPGVQIHPHARKVLAAYCKARHEARTSAAPKITFRFVRSAAKSPTLSPWEVLITVEEAVPVAQPAGVMEPVWMGQPMAPAMAARLEGHRVVKEQAFHAAETRKAEEATAAGAKAPMPARLPWALKSLPTRAFARGPAPSLGVDINGDHLAWCLVSADGNPLGFGRVEMPLLDKSAGQRAAIMGDAAAAIVRLAAEHGAWLVLEDLDFARRKTEMAVSPGSKRRNRALSAFPYGQLHSLLARQAARRGVAMLRVNPAYTSVVGRVKHAPLHGVDTHRGAALTIARRGIGFGAHYRHAFGSDRQPLGSAVHETGTGWPLWEQIRKRLRQHEAADRLRGVGKRGVRPRTLRPSLPRVGVGIGSVVDADGIPDFACPQPPSIATRSDRSPRAAS